MDTLNLKKIVISIALTGKLVILYFLGLSSSLNGEFFILSLVILPIFIIINMLLMAWFCGSQSKPKIIQTLWIWLLLSIVYLYVYIIGLTIPLMQSANSMNMGFVMIPLLVILNIIIFDRFHYYIKHADDMREDKND